MGKKNNLLNMKIYKNNHSTYTTSFLRLFTFIFNWLFVECHFLFFSLFSVLK